MDMTTNTNWNHDCMAFPKTVGNECYWLYADSIIEVEGDDLVVLFDENFSGLLEDLPSFRDADMPLFRDTNAPHKKDPV